MRLCVVVVERRMKHVLLSELKFLPSERQNATAEMSASNLKYGSLELHK